MTDDRTLVRMARAWLEDGPTRAPERAVDAALTRIAATSQERAWPRPLRSLHLRPVRQSVVTAAAIVVVLLLGATVLFIRSPQPGPAESPSPSPTTSVLPSGPPSSASSGEAGPPVLTATFRSPRNGFSMTYPGDWTVTPATARWEAGAVNLWGSAALDEFRGSTVRFAGTSQPLAGGQTAADWLVAYAPSSCLGEPSGWPAVVVGTATGYITADGCEVPDPPIAKGGRLFDAVVVVGGRAYNFTMEGELTRADFMAVLAAVTIDPASAVDEPPPP